MSSRRIDRIVDDVLNKVRATRRIPTLSSSHSAASRYRSHSSARSAARPVPLLYKRGGASTRHLQSFQNRAPKPPLTTGFADHIHERIAKNAQKERLNRLEGDIETKKEFVNEELKNADLNEDPILTSFGIKLDAEPLLRRHLDNLHQKFKAQEDMISLLRHKLSLAEARADSIDAKYLSLINEHHLLANNNVNLRGEADIRLKNMNVQASDLENRNRILAMQLNEDR